MTTTRVETVRPISTGSIELIEDQLVYQRRTRNVTKEDERTLGLKLKLSGEGIPKHRELLYHDRPVPVTDHPW